MSVETAELANGLRIVTDRVDTVQSVSLGLWVGVGARHEAEAENGVSHFLEHMAFKGTPTRSAFRIAAEIEDIGGHLNAYTSRETTVYHATVLKQHVSVALDVLADILRNSIFDEAELERERNVILQEIRQAADTPEDVIFDRFQETAFPGQPLGRPILGTSEVVSGLPRRALTDHVGAHYGADRMILAAAGALDHDRIVGLAERFLGGIGPAGGEDPYPARYEGGDWRQVRDLEQAHLVVGFEGLRFGDEDYYPLAVLSTALGGGMSSRLFQELRERRGLVYSVYTFSSSYLDGGLFGLYAGTGADEIGELVAVAGAELARAAGEPMAGTEIARARTLIKAGALLSLESMAARAERLAMQMHVHGRTIPIEDIAARIDAVGAEDVRRVAGRLFSSKPVVAALGPVARLADYDAVAAQLG